ncbi:MAG: DUF1566 domain-containing protein [Deltaproteobacteria bacterium]|nr:MAG: DUF1566 domain-containing protein [Deltaproteobacteria bacterium]
MENQTMGEPYRPKVHQTQSKEVIEFKISLNITRDFLCLVQLLDTLPNMKRVPYDQTRSLYQAVSKGRDIHNLGKELEGFFGAAVKPAGQQMPLKMRFNPSIKYLNGIRDEQALFIKKTKNGFYYGALFPWYKKTENITVHLGYCGSKMSSKDNTSLEKLVKTKALNEKIFNEFEAGKGSRIHGISLASFLYMAQFEKFTCTLTVETNGTVGHLHLSDGELAVAEAGSLKNRGAAYEIISWQDSEIEITAIGRKRKNEIKQPLTDILAEALRRRKETRPAKGGPAAAAAARPTGEQVDRYQMLRDMAAEPEKPFKRVAFRIVGAVIILALGIFFTMQVMKSKQIEKEYQNVLTQLEEQQTSEDQKLLLQFFINSHEPSKYTAAAEQRMREIDQMVEVDAYNTVLDEVEKLPLDQYYEEKATVIYEKFLTQYPDGNHVPEVQEKISELPRLIDDVDYRKLQEAVKLDYDNRIEAYMGYLVKHPTGRHKGEVEGLIADMSEEYYAQLMEEIPLCDKQAKWDRCILLCDNFISYFKNNYREDEIKVLKLEMEDKNDFAQLMSRVRRLGTRYEAAKQVLTEYLKENPHTSQAQNIEEKIANIDKKLKVIKDWQTVVAFSKNSQNNIGERINALQDYLFQNAQGPFAKEANFLLTQLKKEDQEISQRRTAEAQSRRLAAIQKENQRLQREREKLITQIGKTKGRYVANGDGTFTDTKTGLMWCLLDSYVELGQCQNYESAIQYVKNLDTGGHQDWRLPLGSELAKIYKDTPFFPGNGSKWYWTSEIFVKGYHKQALIVTSKRERTFKRQQKDLTQCGAVRAVRP